MRLPDFLVTADGAPEDGLVLADGSVSARLGARLSYREERLLGALRTGIALLSPDKVLKGGKASLECDEFIPKEPDIDGFH